jgi:hypothetical protein
MIDGMSPKSREIVLSAKAAEWQPVSALSELLNTIAATAKGNDAEGQRLLINCGKYMAREATNTFLRLLMRMLTPALFAKKLPEFWRRDCNRGTFVVDLSSDKLLCKLVDTEGFDHAVCTACGFVTFALEAMGKNIEQTTIREWSLKSPSQSGNSFELVWSK